MEEKRTSDSSHVGRRFAAASGIFLSFVVAFEIVIMISPFAFFFYAAFNPFLLALNQSSMTRWLTAQCCPNMVEMCNDPLNNYCCGNGGGMQVILTVAAVAGIAIVLRFPLPQAVLFGFLASLSSTAIVLKMYTDRTELDTAHGRLSTGILLFQDIAVVPMMLLLPILGQAGAAGAALAVAVGLGVYPNMDAVDDLVKIRGIGEKSIVRLKPYLTVAGTKAR